ncbi:MAG: tetratricopeptide repeat protein [Acidobacteriota bacterium]
MKFRSTLLAAALIALAALGRAQEPGRPSGYLSGEVISDGGRFDPGLTIELTGQDHWPARRASVSLSGDFQMEDIAPGDYELQVLAGDRQVIQHQLIHISPAGNTVIVRLPEIKQERPPSGTVSVEQLQRKIPSKAVKEVKKAQQSDQPDQAIEHLKKAIEIEPDYAEAHNNLGVQYLKQNQLDPAREQFEKAVELAPSLSPALCNLSVVLYNQGRIPEAERSAREALKDDVTNVRARMMLGLTLLAQNKQRDEAIGYIRAAEQEFPNVRIAAAELFARQGYKKQAAEELKGYLASAPADKRAQIEAWIAELDR